MGGVSLHCFNAGEIQIVYLQISLMIMIGYLQTD